jgi:arsenate reductase
MNNPVSVLFLCTGNSCRSQMAEGFARHLHPGVIHAWSAGIEKHGMNPRTIQVMAEAGIDITGQYSKTVNDLDLESIDIVISVCDHAQETCPVLPGGTRRLHHSFADPAGSEHLENDEAVLAVYRRVRDEIHAWIRDLPAHLS